MEEACSNEGKSGIVSLLLNRLDFAVLRFTSSVRSGWIPTHWLGQGRKVHSLIIRAAILLLCGLYSANAQAHPHVWVDAASEVVFDDKGRISAIGHHWRFDEAFSAFAIQGLDENGDGVYSREELQPLAQINVESLADFDFFTFLETESYIADFGAPEEYWLEQSGSHLILHFTLPLSRPLKSSAPVTLQVFDPEYFVAFSLPSEEAVRTVGAPDNCSLTVKLAQELDAQSATALAAIGPDQRELPPELKELTEELDNTAIVTCS